MLTPLQEIYIWIADQSFSGILPTPTPTEILEKIEELLEHEKDHFLLAFNSTGENITSEEWFSMLYNGKDTGRQLTLFPLPKE